MRGKGASHCKVYGHSPVICAKVNRSRRHLGYGLGWAVGIMLDGGPEMLRDVAMATTFGTKIAINWFCVNDSN